LDDIERFLPFAKKLARMQEPGMPRFRLRLKEAGMINELTEMREEAEAKGEAKAAARAAQALAAALSQASRAMVASFLRLMERGVVTREMVRTELQDLMDAGAITREIGQEALSQLQ
jgi:hypothetical protein